jgi:hypothetical protein
MEIIDTNILYYKFKRKNYEFDISDKHISSINALEFLKNIEKVHTNSAKYYIPLDRGLSFHFDILLSRLHKDRPFNKRVSDFITFEFNNEFPSYNLYNNLSIQQVINNRLNELLKASINFLPKEDFKDIYGKFNFMLDYHLNCISLEKKDIDLALELLSKFLMKHSLKEDFRNCWNDLLIAATAVNKGFNLISKDKLLNHFVASELNAKERKITHDLIEYDFSSNDVSERKFQKFESKGYINRSWNYRMSKR